MKILRVIAAAYLIGTCFLIAHGARAQGGSEAMNKPGAHLVLLLDVAEARAYWVSSMRDEIRHRLRLARIPFREIALADNALRVRLARPENTDAALKALADLAPADPSGNFEALPSVERGAQENQENDVVVAQGEGGNITIMPTEVGLERRASLALDETVAIANRRLEGMGITASAVRRGRDQIYVHAPSLQDTAQLKGLLTNSAQLTFHEVHPVMRAEQARQGRMPVGYKIYSGPAGELLLRELPVIRGNDLADAYAVLDQRTGEPVVGFRFNTVGALAFARFTAASIGRPFAIVLGDVVLSAPVIREAILDGAGQVSGNFTVEDVQQLAVLFRAGAMPAKLAVVEERIVPAGR
jgi:SecD/SecF fusion protein